MRKARTNEVIIYKLFTLRNTTSGQHRTRLRDTNKPITASLFQLSFPTGHTLRLLKLLLSQKCSMQPHRGSNLLLTLIKSWNRWQKKKTVPFEVSSFIRQVPMSIGTVVVPRDIMTGINKPSVSSSLNIRRGNQIHTDMWTPSCGSGHGAHKGYNRETIHSLPCVRKRGKQIIREGFQMDEECFTKRKSNCLRLRLNHMLSP